MPLIPYISSRPHKLPPSARAVVSGLVVAIFPILVFGQTSSQANASQAWRKYTGKDQEFSVRMPQRPLGFSTLIRSKSNKQIRELTYSAYVNGVVYLVVSYDQTSLKETFEYFRRNHCSEAKVTATRDKNLAGFAGKEYSLKFGNVVGTVDVYATKKHGFVVAIVQATDNAPLREYFLSTFSLSGADAQAGSPPDMQSLPVSDSPHIATNDKQTRRPVVVAKPAPAYTDEARAAGITGTVVLRVIFFSSGEVANIVVIRGLPKGLTEQATEAAKHLRFIPGTKNGEFISHWMELQYNFDLY